MKNTIISLLLLLFGIQVIISHAQTNPLPAEVKKAFRKGTRSIDGKPGLLYWQNSASYQIDAELFVEESAVKGSETVKYFNNSPDTLKQLVVRLYPDFYKKGTVRDWPIGDEDLTDGMTYKNLKVFQTLEENDMVANLHRTPTNLIIDLKGGIQPGDSVTFQMDWKMSIPQKKWARMGNYFGDRLFVAYWYPQIAVYDDIDGWDRVEYYGMVEFYNDFNDFDIRIKAPEGFMIWATGKLENEKQLFTKKVLRNLDKARESDEVTSIFTTKDCENKSVLKSKNSNTWHFTAKSVPDFTFAASSKSNWDGTSVVVDTLTKRRVLTDVIYTESPRTYANAAEWSHKSVDYMSKQLPAYPFPYEHMTSFSNGRKSGGMESPMMANNGDPDNEADSYATLFHEISHSFFPFFMGTNERKYAWMDEGWAAFLPIGFMEQYYPEHYYFKRIMNRFEALNGSEKEVTLMTLSYQIGDYNSYRIHAYNRSAMAYYYLLDVMGDSLFKLALHAYIDRWNGKHPIPYDFFNTFTDVSGLELGWFFKPWFFDRAFADLGIKKVTNDNRVVVENYGGLPLPVKLVAEFTDGTGEEAYLHTGVWATGNSAVILEFAKNKHIRKLILGSDLIPDINDQNNVFYIED